MVSSAAPRPGPSRVHRGRFALAAGSLLTTTLVACSATGMLPTPGSGPMLDAGAAAATNVVGTTVADTTVADTTVAGAVAGTTAASLPAKAGAHLGARAQVVPTPDPRPASGSQPPTASGHGRRVVFDQRTQHVWLVAADGDVTRDYPVSGSVTDNLAPGTYAVYSRSSQATSFDLASTMRFMVRFAQGTSSAIGFHSIPVDARGRPLQTRAELGTPQSHGCIRQRPADARALWRFAGLGTTVVVR